MSRAWHLEARRLRRQGHAIRDIARILRRSPSGLRWVLDENGERGKQHARYHGVKAPRKPQPKREPEPPRLRWYADNALIQAHGPARIPRKLIDREALARILAERRGDIPTAELMRAITL